MLTKEMIDHTKREGTGGILRLINTHSDSESILFILKNLGYLSRNFDDGWVMRLLTSPNQQIRLWAVKTLGKTKNSKNREPLQRIAFRDASTEVRREAISSIGRLKDRSTIPILFAALQESDPKIVLQAIRGLLPFKGDSAVDRHLMALRHHPNELIDQLIAREYEATTAAPSSRQPHADSPDSLKNVVVLGDARDALELAPDDSFHLTFTSPPYYNARDYSIYRSYREYLELLAEVFELTHKKTKEGRYLLVNTSPVIMPRISRQHSSRRYPIPFDIHHFLTKMGWDFIDDIVWVKPESSVKNRNAGFLQHRKPLAYKPNARTEYVMVYRKRTERLIDWNIRQYHRQTVAESRIEGEYETSNVWQIDPRADRVHSAVFPFELCRRVIQYYSFRGDLVFDPFAGSGTLGITAKHLGRYFFLTERDPKYFEYMKSRMIEATIFEDARNRSEFLTLNELRDRVTCP